MLFRLPVSGLNSLLNKLPHSRPQIKKNIHLILQVRSTKKDNAGQSLTRASIIY